MNADAHPGAVWVALCDIDARCEIAGRVLLRTLSADDPDVAALAGIYDELLDGWLDFQQATVTLWRLMRASGQLDEAATADLAETGRAGREDREAQQRLRDLAGRLPDGPAGLDELRVAAMTADAAACAFRQRVLRMARRATMPS